MKNNQCFHSSYLWKNKTFLFQESSMKRKYIFDKNIDLNSSIPKINLKKLNSNLHIFTDF